MVEPQPGQQTKRSMEGGAGWGNGLRGEEVEPSFPKHILMNLNNLMLAHTHTHTQQ